ncbi:MAG: DUF3786 domain-containing protein, partial [Chloroflexi bacterium]|nr:DUF3786 domain-containing protein [Chloroflexota bacterium]
EPWRLGQRTGARYDAHGEGIGEFRFLLWGRETVLEYPLFKARDGETGRELDALSQALLVYYFHTCDGAEAERSWISFTDLPDGRFYTQAFQGYTGGELARTFGNEITLFEAAAQKAGGRHFPLGNAAYYFPFLPKAHILTVCWLGDEEFPSSFQVLFDAAAAHFLPTDAWAIAGSVLTRRLIAMKERRGLSLPRSCFG